MDNKVGQVEASLPATGPGVTRSPNFRQIYANVCRTAFSNWDIQLTFSLGTNDASGAGLVEEQATVFMSPTQAKAVAGILVQAVLQFEEKFGEIKLDDQAQAALEQLPTANASAKK